MLLQKCNLPIYAKLSAYNTLKSTLENGKYKFNSISIEEQVKLGHMFKQIDNLITLHQQI